MSNNNRVPTDMVVDRSSGQKLDALLAENAQQSYDRSKGVQVPYNYAGAIVTFVDDDGTSSFLTRSKPTYDSKGVKCSLGIITSDIDTNGYMALSDLVTLQNEGFEILSHTKTHGATIFKASSYDLSQVTDSAIEIEYSDSQQWLKDNGFNGWDTLVFPWGNFGTQAVRYKKLARKYYRYALNALGGTYNPSPSDNMYLNRVFIDITQDFNTVLKPIIDSTLSNNGWLIIGSHSADTTYFSSDYLATIISYIQSLNIPILPFGEATKYKGNALSIGEYTDTSNRVFVGNNGKSIIDGSGGQAVSIIKGAYTGTMNDPITSYTSYTLTISQIPGSRDTLTTEGGVLQTYRGDQYYSYQTYNTYNTKRQFIRKWDEVVSPNAWGTWIEMATVTALSTAGNLNVIKGTYAQASKTMNDSITTYTQYKMTIGQLSSAGDVLSSVGGTLETFHGDDYYSFQRFSNINGAVYFRKWTGTDAAGSWGAWKQVTLT